MSVLNVTFSLLKKVRSYSEDNITVPCLSGLEKLISQCNVMVIIFLLFKQRPCICTRNILGKVGVEPKVSDLDVHLSQTCGGLFNCTAFSDLTM